MVMVTKAIFDSGGDDPSVSIAASVTERKFETLGEQRPLVGGDESGESSQRPTPLFAMQRVTARGGRFRDTTEECGVGRVFLTEYMHCCPVAPAGKKVNDLHVNVQSHEAFSEPPPSTRLFGDGTVSGNGHTLNFEQEEAVKPGTVYVCWVNTIRSDTLSPNDPGNWTRDGKNVGPVRVPSDEDCNHSVYD